MVTVQDLKAELRIDLHPDPWGHAMGAWFDCAGILYQRTDGAGVPGRWQYYPGAGGPEVLDGPVTEVMREADNETLRRFGDLLDRYTDFLRHLGWDY